MTFADVTGEPLHMSVQAIHEALLHARSTSPASGLIRIPRSRILYFHVPMRRLVILGIMGIMAAVSTGCDRPLPRKPGQPIVPAAYTASILIDLRAQCDLAPHILPM